jgi:hypothetical protein
MGESASDGKDMEGKVCIYTKRFLRAQKLEYPFTNKDFYATIKIRRYCREIKNRRKVLSQFSP